MDFNTIRNDDRGESEDNHRCDDNDNDDSKTHATSRSTTTQYYLKHFVDNTNHRKKFARKCKLLLISAILFTLLTNVIQTNKLLRSIYFYSSNSFLEFDNKRRSDNSSLSSASDVAGAARNNSQQQQQQQQEQNPKIAIVMRVMNRPSKPLSLYMMDKIATISKTIHTHPSLKHKYDFWLLSDETIYDETIPLENQRPTEIWKQRKQQQLRGDDGKTSRDIRIHNSNSTTYNILQWYYQQRNYLNNNNSSNTYIPIPNVFPITVDMIKKEYPLLWKGYVYNILATTSTSSSNDKGNSHNESGTCCGLSIMWQFLLPTITTFYHYHLEEYDYVWAFEDDVSTIGPFNIVELISNWDNKLLQLQNDKSDDDDTTTTSSSSWTKNVHPSASASQSHLRQSRQSHHNYDIVGIKTNFNGIPFNRFVRYRHTYEFDMLLKVMGMSETLPIWRDEQWEPLAEKKQENQNSQQQQQHDNNNGKAYKYKWNQWNPLQMYHNIINDTKLDNKTQVPRLNDNDNGGGGPPLWTKVLRDFVLASSSSSSSSSRGISALTVFGNILPTTKNQDDIHHTTEIYSPEWTCMSDAIYRHSREYSQYLYWMLQHNVFQSVECYQQPIALSGNFDIVDLEKLMTEKEGQPSGLKDLTGHKTTYSYNRDDNFFSSMKKSSMQSTSSTDYHAHSSHIFHEKFNQTTLASM